MTDIIIYYFSLRLDLLFHRITAEGVQLSENPIVSDDQWEALQQMFTNEDLKVNILLLFAKIKGLQC